MRQTLFKIKHSLRNLPQLLIRNSPHRLMESKTSKRSSRNISSQPKHSPQGHTPRNNGGGGREGENKLWFNSNSHLGLDFVFAWFSGSFNEGGGLEGGVSFIFDFFYCDDCTCSMNLGRKESNIALAFLGIFCMNFLDWVATQASNIS